jgi:endonuclease-8
MPEGDTVWMTAHVLETGLAGKQLTSSDFRVPQLATVSLAGWTVTESGCYGKHLLLRLRKTDRHVTLHSHLRMDGAWRVYGPSDRWVPKPRHTIRVILNADDTTAVGYHLHELSVVRAVDERRLIAHLGPDLLGPKWDLFEAVQRLQSNADTAIAEALLDQRNLAGIGNLYKAESLFVHGTWPWTPVRKVNDLPGLVTIAQRQMLANLGRWTQSTTGSLLAGEATFVYGRRGRSCRRCGTPIRSADQGERITYWCPACQPQPATIPDPAPASTR